jgi:hypothetical protein
MDFMSIPECHPPAAQLQIRRNNRRLRLLAPITAGRDIRHCVAWSHSSKFASTGC